METTVRRYYPYLFSEEIDRAVYEWWEELKGNTGERARLRRCSSPVEVAYSQAYVRLVSKLRQLKLNDAQHLDKYLNIAAMAGLLAHVRTNTGRIPGGDNTPVDAQQAEKKAMKSNRGSMDFGKVLGFGSESQKVLKELRFRRLLQTDTDNPDTLYHTMIRVVRMCNYTVPLLSFAATILLWKRETTRQQLAFGYYDAAPTRQ